MSEVTDLLRSWYEDDPAKRDRLVELVYRQLRAMAARRLQSERAEHTLSTTALVNEAYLRLRQVRQVEWKNREHFLAIASQAMHRVLLDHARERLTDRRGGGQPILPLEEAIYLAHERPSDYVRLAQTLEDLQEVDPVKAAIVNLRYFAGLTLTETASAVGLSRATVARHWKIAMGWLHRELSANAEECDHG